MQLWPAEALTRHPCLPVISFIYIRTLSETDHVRLETDRVQWQNQGRKFRIPNRMYEAICTLYTSLFVFMHCYIKTLFATAFSMKENSAAVEKYFLFIQNIFSSQLKNTQ